MLTYILPTLQFHTTRGSSTTIWPTPITLPRYVKSHDVRPVVNLLNRLSTNTMNALSLIRILLSAFAGPSVVSSALTNWLQSPSRQVFIPAPSPSYVLPTTIRTYKQLRKHCSQQVVLLLMLKAYTSILSIGCTDTSQTATTTIRLADMDFTAAADSQSGTNTIHPRVLEKLMSSSLPLPHSHCNVTVECADRSLHKITSQVLLKFSLPEVSTISYTMPFLVMETPHDFILSMYTMTTTKLGQHIFNQQSPNPMKTPTTNPNLPNVFPQPISSITDIIDALDFNTPEVYATILSIIVSAKPDFQEDSFVDFDLLPQPFNEKINSSPTFDPPAIEAIGPLGDELRKLINKYADSVFRSSLPPEPAKVPPFEIEFAALALPVTYCPPRRLAPKYEQALKDSVKDLLDNNIAVPSHCAFASPIVMASQKDKIRMCIDYRELNSITKKMRYPLPNPSNIFQNLAGNQYFAHMDLRSGYHQLAMSPEASEWSAFVTPFGQYKFLRVPFGLANAPAWFQRAMSELVLAGLVGIISYVFVDDIIVYGRTESEFLANMETVLNRLKDFNIVLKGSKCHIGVSEVSFLGFIADSTGIRHDPKRTQQFLAIPFPRTKKALRSFLGLGNYFRDFVYNYAALSKPLSAIVNAAPANTVEDNPTTQAAFQDLKLAISNTVKNFYLDYDQAIYLHTDASNNGLGGILFQIVDQQFRPIQFVSKALTDVEINWKTQELESFAIIYCIKKLDHFIRGSSFILHTDHRNLVYIKSSTSAKITRWSMLLPEYDFELSLVAGKDNIVADILSRVYPDHPRSFKLEPLPPPDDSYTDYCSLNSKYNHPSPEFPYIDPIPICGISPKPEISQQLIDVISMYHNDIFGHPDALRTTAMMRSHGIDDSDLTEAVQQFVSTCPLCSKGRGHPKVFLPTSDNINTIKAFHNHIFGHHGIDQTLKLLRLHDHNWDGIKSHVVDFIHSCPHCQKNKSRCKLATPEFTTTEVYEPFMTVAIDTLGPFPPTVHGHKYVMVIVCCFTSYVELIPTFDNTAAAAAEALLQVFGRYGASFYLRSDNAPGFAGEVMAAFRALLDIQPDFTIPYRPQSNGIVERKNSNVLGHLRSLLFSSGQVQENWYKLLPIVQRICNATDVSSVGCSPAELIFGNMIHLNRGLDKAFSPLAPTVLHTSDYINQLVSGQTSLIQASQRYLANIKDIAVAAHRSVAPTIDFPKDSYVLIAYPTDFRPKLANQMRGPFRVLSQVKSMYQVQSFIDPDKIISIHSSRLKPFYQDDTYHITPLEAASTDNQEYVIDYISEHRGDPKDVENLEFLIHWLGYDETEASWQSYDTISSTAALDSYILHHVERSPDLVALIPKKDRKLLSRVVRKGITYYIFEFLKSTFALPVSIAGILQDRAALRRQAQSLPLVVE